MKIFNFNIIPKNNIQNFRGKNPDEISGAKFPEFGITSPFERLQQDVFVRGKEDSRNSLGYELPADVEICESLFSGFGLTPEETFPWRVSFTLSTYFDLVSDCKEYMLRYGKKAFDKVALDDISDDAKEAALGLIDSSLDTPEEILNIAKLYKTINSKRPNSLVFKGTEFLYAYTFLKSQRSEFLNFEDIVMQGAYNNLYMDEDNDLEEYVKFAKDLGFKNENAFFRKFTHFAPSFDNFEDREDRFAAFSYIYSTYPIKDYAIYNISAKHPQMHGKFITQIYADNCDVVDYLYEENPYDWVNRLDNYFAQTLGQPKITAQAANYLLPLGNMRTAEGKIELEDLLASEGITHKDINALLKTSQYADVDPLYFVINKKSITDLLTNFGNFDEQSAQDIYSRFHQTLNVIYDESDPNQVKSFNEFFSLVDAFGLKNDKDFYNFEQQVEQTYLKQGKNKKQQVNKKPKADNIKEFISLCSYLTDDMILKYQKDKYYPLKSELLKRKAQFEKVKPEFEKQIAALNVQHIFQSPYDVFVEYEKLSRLYPDVRVFVQKLVDRKNEENDSKTQVAQTRNEFLKHFKDKEKLELFLAKNSFTIDDSKESQTYSKIYLRILNALFEGKDEKKANEYLEKLIMNNFLPNIKPSILKFADKKTDFELGTLFEIILDEGYENPSDVYSFINKYRNKNGDISSFLQSFKKYDIDFETYLKRIENVQKEFINAGIPITIDNDNVSKIDLNEYSEGKITDFKLAQLAKNILTPQGEGNFISGLKLAFIPVKVSIGEKAIGKEILASQNGRYSEELSNIIRVFNLQMEKINPSNTPEANIDWEKLIDDDFAKFINSSSWLDFQENGKLPNLTLHAKMRLIDRFVLDSDDKTAKDLYSQETKEELKNVLKTVYTTTPIKLYKSQDENHDDRFVAFFNYGSNEIKAVFNKNGQMLTIIKR